MFNKIQKKIRISYTCFITIFGIVQFIPNNALSDPLSFKTWINFKTQKSFSNQFNQNNTSNKMVGFNFNKKINNISSNVNLNYVSKQKFTFDQSFIQYENNNTIFGIGKIDRNWSFSPNTSLILSANSRPSDAIFFHMRNNQKSENLLLSFLGPWSFEAFNSFISNDTKIHNSMLLGLRATIKPVHNLQFEIIKTSQWGGSGQKGNLPSFLAAIAGNTNGGEYSNINQLAGFGFSWLSDKKKNPLRIYGQLIGEDEAGNLPSCFMKMVGSELGFNDSHIAKIGIEYIDTRIDLSTNGHCGANTAYNNNIYDYTNYGLSLGAPIDSEGKSIHIWASTKLLKKTNIKYSIKKAVINDTSFPEHRLSESKKSGWIKNIEAFWELENFKIKSRISHQNFSLNKENIKNGLSFGIYTEFVF